jgi:hypothetical protein
MGSPDPGGDLTKLPSPDGFSPLARASPQVRGGVCSVCTPDARVDTPARNGAVAHREHLPVKSR